MAKKKRMRRTFQEGRRRGRDESATHISSHVTTTHFLRKLKRQSKHSSSPIASSKLALEGGGARGGDGSVSKKLTDGPLSRDDELVVERVYHRQSLLPLEPPRLRGSLVVVVPDESHLHAPPLPPAVSPHGPHRDRGRREGHAYHRAASEDARRQGHALRVVPGRARDDAAVEGGGGEGRHLVVRAAYLEREHRLGVLPLEQDGVVEELFVVVFSFARAREREERGRVRRKWEREKVGGLG